MTPSLQNVHDLFPRIHEHAILHGKKDFGDVIKLKNLRWRDYSGYSKQAQCNHKSPSESEEML